MKKSLTSEMKSFLKACLNNVETYNFKHEELKSLISNYLKTNIDFIYWQEENALYSYQKNQMQKAFGDLALYCEEFTNGNAIITYSILDRLFIALSNLFIYYKKPAKRTRKVTTKTTSKGAKKMTENNSINSLETQENQASQPIENSQEATVLCEEVATSENALASDENSNATNATASDDTQENAVASDEITTENNTLKTLESQENQAFQEIETAEKKQLELREKESKNFSISTIEKLQDVMHYLEKEIDSIKESNRISQIDYDVTSYDISKLRFYISIIYQFLQDNVNLSHYYLKKGYVKFKDYKECEAIEALKAWQDFQIAQTTAEQKKQLLKVLNNLNNFSLMNYYEYGIKRLDWEIEKKKKDMRETWYQMQRDCYAEEIAQLEKQLQDLKNSQIKALASDENSNTSNEESQDVVLSDDEKEEVATSENAVLSDETTQETTENNTLESIETQEIQGIQAIEKQEKAVLSDDEILVKCQLSFNFETVESEESQENQGFTSNSIDEMSTLILEESEEEATELTSEQIQPIQEMQEKGVLSSDEIETQEKAVLSSEETTENNSFETLESEENQGIQEESQPKQITFKSLFIKYSAFEKKYYQNYCYTIKEIKLFLSKMLEMAIDENNSILESSIENYINCNPGECVANLTEKQIDSIKSKFNTIERLANLLVYTDENCNYKFKSKVDSFFVDTTIERLFTFEKDIDRTYFPNWQAIYEDVKSFFQLFDSLFIYTEQQETQATQASDQTTENNTAKTAETQENQAFETIEKPKNRFYGYAMVNTHTQSLEMQERHILSYNTDCKIYKDKLARKKDIATEFSKMYKHLKTHGGCLVIDSIHNLASTPGGAIEKYKLLFENNIQLIFLQESSLNTQFYYDLLAKQEATNFDTVKNALLSTIENIINSCFLTLYKRKKAHADATAEGIGKAKKSGAKIGNQKGEIRERKDKQKNMRRIKSLSQFFNGNLSDYQLSKKLGISRHTVMKYRKELSEMQEKA